MKDDAVTKPSRNFLDLSEMPGTTLRTILEAGKAMKARRSTQAAARDRVLEGKAIVLIFEQPSLRTRMSFEVGIRDLGGEAIMVTGKEIELGEREAIKDTARVMSRYADAIMIRMLDHAKLAEFAHWADVPVINGLTKTSHPCQVMADVMTFEERLGPIKDRIVAWTGDANNVLASWIHAAARLDFKLRIATPSELAPRPELIAWAKKEGAAIELTQDAFAAVDGADAVVTDTWVSMGDAEKERRHNLLQPYHVNSRLLKAAHRDAIFLHCLPAHRGDEVTDEVIDSPQSAVLDEAENRLHAQKGVLAWCFDALPA
jgi:ornithine carbamoyltransferase